MAREGKNQELALRPKRRRKDEPELVDRGSAPKRIYLLRPWDVLRVVHIIFEIVRYKLGKLFVRLRIVRTSNPVRLRQMFERLGATFLKVGQILAMRPDFLPIEYCDELMKLLDKIPPFSTDQARRIIEETLGASPEDLYASFDAVPLAAATFGQVHEARLRDPDVRVVVKVQRPGMDVAIARDLRIMFFFAWLFDRTRISATRMVPKIQEFARWTREELDYRWEAKHTTRFRDNMRGYPTVRVPKVFWEYTGRRVMTMEFVKGIWLSEVLRAINAGDSAAMEKFRRAGFDGMVVARNLHENFLASAFRCNLFHADQHAANLLVEKNNRIVYIDFGIVGKWDNRTQEIAMRFLKAVNDENVDEAYRVFREDVARPSRRTRIEDFEREFKSTMSDWLFHLGFRESSPEQRSMARLLLKILGAVRRHKLELPLDTLAYYRTIITLDSIYLRIAPRYNARRVGREWFGNLLADRALDVVTSADGRRTLIASYLTLLRDMPQRLDQNRQDALQLRRDVNARLSELGDSERSLRRAITCGALGLGLLMFAKPQHGWTELSDLSRLAWSQLAMLGSAAVFLLVMLISAFRRG